MPTAASPLGNLGHVALGEGRSDLVAIVASPDERTALAVTYADLDARRRQLARIVDDRTEPGGRVAILGANSPSYLAAVLAVASAGRAVVPLTPRQGSALIATVLRRSTPQLVLVDDDHRALLPAGCEAVSLTAGTASDAWTAEDECAAHGEVALVMYTSGSTGEPKGVVHTHDSLLTWLGPTFRRSAAGEDLVAVVAAPLAHMNGLMTSLYVLAAGGRLCLLDRFDALRYLRTIGRQRATMVTGVPTMFSALLAALADRPDIDVSCVDLVVCGSAPMSAELRSRLQDAFPGARIQNSYGTTEVFGMFGLHVDGRTTPPGSVGAVVAGAEARLVDGPGEDEGRLLVRTSVSMSGYLDDEATTAQKLRDGWYDTGDIARRDADGFFYIVGRSDDLIVCGAENVYPAQVEALLESHPEVRMAAVVGVADADKGQVPVAYVVPIAGARPSIEVLRAFTLEHGPAYAHPRRIEIREQLPTMASGKVDKAALAADAVTR